MAGRTWGGFFDMAIRFGFRRRDSVNSARPIEYRNRDKRFGRLSANFPVWIRASIFRIRELGPTGSHGASAQMVVRIPKAIDRVGRRDWPRYRIFLRVIPIWKSDARLGNDDRGDAWDIELLDFAWGDPTPMTPCRNAFTSWVRRTISIPVELTPLFGDASHVF